MVDEEVAAVPASRVKALQNDHAVRSRRAYFDCRHGQLHVRTAFPATGGFDEQVTLLCLHGQADTSRLFADLLPALARDRSVYAPDLPGCGESDAPPNGAAGFVAAASLAVQDLAADLRLRQIDVLAVGDAAAVALDLCAQPTDSVRRVVLVGRPPAALARFTRPHVVLAEAGSLASLAPSILRFLGGGTPG